MLIVDTSFFIKWFVDEDDSTIAIQWLANWRAEGVERVVPSHAVAETTNVLIKHVIGETMAFDHALTVISELPRFVRIHKSSLDHSKRALTLCHQFGHRSVYDMHFLALAEELECELWTADERFWRAVNPAFPFVKWLGNERVAAEPPRV
jgi:predicted nucleic acid-binding protein